MSNKFYVFFLYFVKFLVPKYPNLTDNPKYRIIVCMEKYLNLKVKYFINKITNKFEAYLLSRVEFALETVC